MSDISWHNQKHERWITLELSHIWLKLLLLVCFSCHLLSKYGEIQLRDFVQDIKSKVTARFVMFCTDDAALPSIITLMEVFDGSFLRKNFSPLKNLL